MKKLFLLLFTTATCHSCVVDETLDQIIVDATPITESRKTDNVYLVDDEAQGSFAEVDWAVDGTTLSEYLKSEYSDVYAYNGTGGTWIINDGQPAIVYSQQTDNWLDSRWQYLWVENIQTQESLNFTFHDAFASLCIEITNKEKNLHLDVRQIELCNVSTAGIFYFPEKGREARWIPQTSKSRLVYTLGKEENATGKVITIPVTQSLPLIPQKTSAWNGWDNHQLTTGTYLLIDCRIFNLSDIEKGYQEEKDVPVWSDGQGGYAKAAVPVSLNLSISEKSILQLSLESGCPWYDVSDSIPQKILNPILFDATIDDWVNGGQVDITAG